MPNYPDYVVCDRIYSLPVGERWNVCQRLRECHICCACLQDGCLYLEIKDALEAVLVYLVLFRSLSSRSQQVEWLERCWQIPVEEAEYGAHQ